jgi:MFS family permease
MHTEHLSNVRPSWVAFGWFLSAAATGAAIIALLALGLLPWDGTSHSGWLLPAFFAGFFVGGWFTGLRTGAAPILHAVGIGLFSVVAWLAVNLVFGEPTRETDWNALPPALAAGLILLQIIAAALGARLGSREARELARLTE